MTRPRHLAAALLLLAGLVGCGDRDGISGGSGTTEGPGEAPLYIAEPRPASATAAADAGSATAPAPVATDATAPIPTPSRAPRLGLFQHPDAQTPTPATLAEARAIDDIQALIDDGLFDRARVRLTTLFANGGSHPQAFFLQAQLCYLQGDFDAAIPWCQRAIGASSLWAEPRVLLAHCYLRLNRLGAARNVFAEFDAINPASPWGPYGVGVISAMGKDTATAIVQLDRALARDPRHAPSLGARADLARLANDPVLEDSLLQRYLAEIPDSPGVLERLGELAHAANRPDDARHDWERAYALDPDRALARELLGLAQETGDADGMKRWSGPAGQPAAKPLPDQPKD
jgi:tetratricopeptide (TPR) repeat protein